ncbi:antigen 5 like allergen Cul n 1-like [Musca vetustissima]|uniref:antigen 5 like allergen Cul n 1-like n=1 Tax=Musca vetustissima TaxID=27455 RepID=UPI002AB7D1A6|nr:antigen 5 like allergen Cul n 1-like [Musca vetustissima]
MNKFAIILIVSTLSASVIAYDYCSTKLCNKGVTHIACGDKEFDESCPDNAAFVHIDDNLKAEIVRAHNEKRNLVAGGGVNGLAPACRMATMEWDDELAAVAAYNVLQCKMAHDKCRNTETFKYAGQNLAWRSFWGQQSYSTLFQKSFAMWYDEVKDVKMDYLNEFPVGYKGPKIGHFTVMMADRNIRVGCAAATYDDTRIDGDRQIFLIACNYATTNMLGFPIYKNCSSPATSCSTGTNPQYPNLCSTSEVYNVNKWY